MKAILDIISIYNHIENHIYNSMSKIKG